MDVTGAIMLGTITGLGGGVLRDLIIGDIPPVAFREWLYAIPILSAALIIFLFFSHVKRFTRTINLFDAYGLGLFCVLGAHKALEAGMNPFFAAILGMTTAVGGGLIRDVIANQTPIVMRQDEIYAIPAFIGASALVIFYSVGWFNAYTALGSAGLAFGLRILSLKYRWRIPPAAGYDHRPPSERDTATGI